MVKEKGGIGFSITAPLKINNGSVEDKDDNFDVSIFIDMTIWRLLFPDSNIKVEMMLPSWNNFSPVSSMFYCD